MTDPLIVCDVPGAPVPQPRARARCMPKTNNAALAAYPPRTVKALLSCVTAQMYVEEDHPIHDYRERIGSFVRGKCKLEGLTLPIGEPVQIEMAFCLPRPQAHYGTGKNARTIKPGFVDARPTAISKCDVDNLAKGALDGLVSAGVLADDAIVVRLTVSKWYADPRPVGTRIVIGRDGTTDEH